MVKEDDSTVGSQEVLMGEVAASKKENSCHEIKWCALVSNRAYVHACYIRNSRTSTKGRDTGTRGFR